MLHHLSFAVTNLVRSGVFYDATLGALGFRRVFEDDKAIGYGVEDGKDKFCIKLRQNVATPSPGFHIAFAAPSRAAVDAFHAAGLTVGGLDNGAPGLRDHYGPHYYAAFLADPDGYHVEAVINTAP
jgi:catechol 2,3-dioxygenase-like lactoylglutathione lyase family enzyme